MYEYTYDDVNFIGGSERVANAIGKECYYGFSAKQVLEHARNDESSSVLKWVDNDNYKPFGDVQGGWYPFMIVKKEPEPKYVPFQSKEEFLERYMEVKDELGSDSFEGSLLQCGMWLKYKENGDLIQVTGLCDDAIYVRNFTFGVTWKELLNKFKFLDGYRCGKEVKE